MRASGVQEVIAWVINAIVSRSGIVSLGPTLVSKVLRNKTVGGRWEDVDKTNGDDINTRRITEVRQALLVWAVTLREISIIPTPIRCLPIHST